MMLSRGACTVETLQERQRQEQIIVDLGPAVDL